MLARFVDEVIDLKPDMAQFLDGHNELYSIRDGAVPATTLVLSPRIAVSTTKRVIEYSSKDDCHCIPDNYTGIGAAAGLTVGRISTSGLMRFPVDFPIGNAAQLNPPAAPDIAA